MQEYNGKIQIYQKNSESITFNLNVYINKNDSIIQIKKPFYGNVLKIKMIAGKTNIILPSENVEPFYIPEKINRNFRYWLRQCLFSKAIDINNPVEEINFRFQCNKEKNKTNIKINYDNYIIRGYIK